VFPVSSVGMFLSMKSRCYHLNIDNNSKKLRQCCHVDMTAKGWYVSRVEGSGSEWDTGTTRNSGNTSLILLPCQRGNIALSFTIDNVKIVAQWRFVLGKKKIRNLRLQTDDMQQRFPLYIFSYFAK
jgi:hypothetical protein